MRHSLLSLELRVQSFEEKTNPDTSSECRVASYEKKNTTNSRLSTHYIHKLTPFLLFPSKKRGLRGVFLRATLLFLLTFITFASPNNREAAAGWQRQTVDSAGDVGLYTSLAFHPVSGYPYISYYDATNGDLKYARYTGAGWSILTVDSTGNVGFDTSLAFDSNNYVAEPVA